MMLTVGSARIHTVRYTGGAVANIHDPCWTSPCLAARTSSASGWAWMAPCTQVQLWLSAEPSAEDRKHVNMGGEITIPATTGIASTDVARVQLL